jgi:hypothetical protein
MPRAEESFEHIGDIRVGRRWVSLEKFVAAFFAAALLIIGLAFLILYKLNTDDVTGGCAKIATFSLASGESKALTSKNGTPIVIGLTIADSSGGSGTLKVGERTDPVVFYPGSVEERNDVRVGMIGTSASGARSSLRLVASDCSSPAGAK